MSSISNDGGKSWLRPEKAPGFVTKMSKVWGQKTADGKYAIVYNPTDSPGWQDFDVEEPGIPVSLNTFYIRSLRVH